MAFLAALLGLLGRRCAGQAAQGPPLAALIDREQRQVAAAAPAPAPEQAEDPFGALAVTPEAEGGDAAAVLLPPLPVPAWLPPAAAEQPALGQAALLLPAALQPAAEALPPPQLGPPGVEAALLPVLGAAPAPEVEQDGFAALALPPFDLGAVGAGPEAGPEATPVFGGAEELGAQAEPAPAGATPEQPQRTNFCERCLADAA